MVDWPSDQINFNCKVVSDVTVLQNNVMIYQGLGRCRRAAVL